MEKVPKQVANHKTHLVIF